MLKKLILLVLVVSFSLVGCGATIELGKEKLEPVSSELEIVCEQVESILDNEESYYVSVDGDQVVIVGFDNLDEMCEEVLAAIEGNEDYKGIAVSLDGKEIMIVNNNN